MYRSYILSTLVYITIILNDVSATDYWEDRANLIKRSNSQAIGAQIILTEDEEKVNEILMKLKNQEFDNGLQDPSQFLAARHFFNTRDQIRDSAIYKFIQKIPKGASLHSHDTALLSEDALFQLTYEEDLYINFRDDGKINLHFFESDKVPDDVVWLKVAEARRLHKNFDQILRSHLTLVVENPKQVYTNENSVWSVFSNIFSTVHYFIGYKPVFEKYFYEALKELYEDNVMHLEFRSTLPDVYDSERTYSAIEVVGMYKNITERFMADYPRFEGAKIIYAPSRRVDNATMNGYTQTFRQLKSIYGDFVAGFDLVGEEDLGHPLADFIPQLLEIKNETTFFFHSGETNWFGQSTDLNLFDAVLLNTSRIGHGYAILKHPEILRIVKERGIAIEISPISNQALDLVDDLRNHPGNFLISQGYPVVITCDDPTYWGAKALSFDWYQAFMAMASKEYDLRLLKQLAINSIQYSAISEQKKNDFISKWKNDWDDFITQTLVENYNYYQVLNNVDVILN